MEALRRPTSPGRRWRHAAGRLLACALLAMTFPAGNPSAGRSAGQSLSVGQLALLVRHCGDPENLESLGRALHDDRSSIRAAAARVIHAGGAAVPIDVLRNALEVETDPSAAVEEAAALVSLGGAGVVPAVLETGRRFGGDVPGFMREHPGPAEADVTYDSLGRPTAVDLRRAPAGSRCRKVMMALFTAAIAPAGQPVHRATPETIFLLLEEHALAKRSSDAEVEGFRDLSTSSRGPLPPMERTRFVAPDYPDDRGGPRRPEQGRSLD